VKGTFEHIGLNVSGQDTAVFYKEMLAYLEFDVVFEGEGFVGLTDGEMSVWITPAQVEQDYDRDAVGLNHLGLHIGSVAEVDRFTAEFLKPRDVEPILDSPRVLPGSESRPGSYYQVLFTDPDGQLIEVFHAS
jgi:catechol 2,3-dioxygenase-like lactoylglutathione lyase family enzyme